MLYSSRLRLNKRKSKCESVQDGGNSVYTADLTSTAPHALRFVTTSPRQPRKSLAAGICISRGTPTLSRRYSRHFAATSQPPGGTPTSFSARLRASRATDASPRSIATAAMRNRASTLWIKSSFGEAYGSDSDAFMGLANAHLPTSGPAALQQKRATALLLLINFQAASCRCSSSSMRLCIPVQGSGSNSHRTGKRAFDASMAA
mmetsp:Transcript_7452/g.16471  ORF Transcript_7452/g.16471 Transcript_7452/m.16471 type:complete len:204 (-) Transcript_7452:1184-1795(-)